MTLLGDLVTRILPSGSRVDGSSSNTAEGTEETSATISDSSPRPNNIIEEPGSFEAASFVEGSVITEPTHHSLNEGSFSQIHEQESNPIIMPVELRSSNN